MRTVQRLAIMPSKAASADGRLRAMKAIFAPRPAGFERRAETLGHPAHFAPGDPLFFELDGRLRRRACQRRCAQLLKIAHRCPVPPVSCSVNSRGDDQRITMQTQQAKMAGVHEPRLPAMNIVVADGA